MRRSVWLPLVAVAMALQIGSASAYAQGVQRIKAEIGFPFVAGGKDLPAGKYTVELATGLPVVLIGANGSRTLLPVVTLLGRHDQDPDSEFVFDKIEGKSVLSEVWMPKMDGFLVNATSKPHEHAVLGGSNPRK